jgi:hypothetical protein
LKNSLQFSPIQITLLKLVGVSKRLGKRVISNTKCFGHYLRSLAITAIVTFLLPLVLLGGMLFALAALAMVLPEVAAIQTITQRIQDFLSILGNGDSWQGAFILGSVSCLVGMLFDSYAFYRYQGVTHRWFKSR